MGKNPARVLLAVLIALGIFISVDHGLARIQLENSNDSLELAVEYSEIQRLARWSGLSFSELLGEMKDQGVTGVLFKEETLGELENKILWLRSGGELLTDHVLGNNLPRGRISPDATYIVTDNEGIYQRLVEQLGVKAPVLEQIEGEDYYLLSSSLGAGELRTLGLGFSQEGLTAAQEAELNVLLQVQHWPQASPEEVRTIIRDALATDRLTAILFNDGILPGYPRSLEALLQELRGQQVPIGVIEFFPQQGLAQLIQSMDKNAVRLHAIGEQEMLKITPDKAIARFALAATERNNRILMTRLFFRPEVGDWLNYNLNYLGSLAQTMEGEGFVLGPAEPFGSLPTSRTRLLLLGLGVIAGSIMLMEKFLPGRWAWGLGGLGTVLWLLLLGMNQVGTGRLLMALVGVIIFPTLSSISNLKDQGVGLKGSIKSMLGTTLFSLVGAVFLVGLLADVGFMLKIDQFRGVKLAHVIPLVLLIIFCLLWQTKGAWLPKLKSLWEAKISVGWAALSLVLGLAMLVYISRTGNESIGASNLELQLRSLLDQLLVVRPRTKEFLIGHPALMLFFYLGYKPRYLPLLILGAIGQVSLVNTFAHVHTPVLISLFRTFNGWWLGVLLGLLLIVVYKGIVKLGERIEHGS